MNEIKVSIIIPIYNPGELLIKCLDSALEQTLDEIEVLCIDDGSDEITKNILNEYSKKDSRCKIFSQENLGAGYARNNGIKYSKGEYIVFLDSDDWIEPQMCESLYNHAKKLDADLTLFDNVWHREEGSQIDFIHFDKEDYDQDFDNFIFDYHFAKDKVFNGYFGVIWTKFYKSSFIKENKITFPRHKLYNDIEFHIKSLILAKKISYYPEIFYHYNKMGQDSLQTSYRSKRESMVFYDVMEGIRNFLIEQNLMNEFRRDFLDFAFENFTFKLNEINEEFKQDYFLKIKSFFESLLLTPKDFEEINFKHLPYYTHMVSSKDFNEFNARMLYFDKELINPDRYSGVEDNKGIFENEYYKSNKESLFNGFSELNSDGLSGEVSQLDSEGGKLFCFDRYILILENSSVNNQRLKNIRISNLEMILRKERSENEKKDIEIDELKKDLADLKENEKKLKMQNKQLLREKEIFKNNFKDKFKSFFNKS